MTPAHQDMSTLRDGMLRTVPDWPLRCVWAIDPPFHLGDIVDTMSAYFDMASWADSQRIVRRLP